MKAKTTTETKLKPKKIENKSSSIESLTLDQLEKEMIILATDNTTDFLTLMINEKRFNMLEKVANMKMHRLQLKELEKSNEPVDVKPIEVKFISSKTNDNLNRLEKIDNSVKESLNIKQDA